jgi:hypothetical protein
VSERFPKETKDPVTASQSEAFTSSADAREGQAEVPGADMRGTLQTRPALATGTGTNDAVSETVSGVATQEEQLVAQRVAREAVLCDHVYAAKLELTAAGTGVVQTLAQSLIDNCKRLLHTKIKDGAVISGYYGAAAHGYNLDAIEALLPGLGPFLDTIYHALRLERGKITKLLQYCQNVRLFPFHNDEPGLINLHRISISLSEHTPDFAMRFEDSADVFILERGSFCPSRSS